MKVKTNDNVIVIAGKNRGKSGKILRTMEKEKKIVVEKINLITKHIKKTQQKPGSKIQHEAPIDVSNVMVICPNCKKATRVGYKILENGKKQRVCKKCKESLDKISQTTKK
ncbi:50S ribosomal protein L24 [Candidatus Peregrinibacteria bacterium]|nr:50S ribosomal protein L24 [Candidatus Peregrinibacteria bacterium]